MILQRPQVDADAGRGPRPRLGDRRWPRPSRSSCVPVARHRPALHPLHLRHDRAAQGRRPRQRRARGGAALVDGARLRRRPRRRLLGGLRRRLGRRPLVHRLRAAAHRLHHRPLRGQAGRHPGRRRVLAGDRRARGGRAVHRADRLPGDQQGGPARRAAARTRPVRRCARCSWPASGWTRTPTTGRASCSASRSSTTGGRPRPAGRSRPTRSGWSPCRSSPARRPCRCPGYDVRVLDTAGEPAPPDGRARSRSGCRCRRARCPRCGGRRALRRVLPVRASPATT